MTEPRPAAWPSDEPWPPASRIERVVQTHEGTLFILEDETQIRGTDTHFGGAYQDRERTEAAVAARYQFDYPPPAKRNPSEKFKIQGQKAVNTLEKIGFVSDEAANRFFMEFLAPLSEECGTMNGAAFAFVMACYDWDRRRFVKKKRPENLSWEELVRFVDDKAYRQGKLNAERRELLEDLIREHGITGRDLVRYFVFAEKRMG